MNESAKGVGPELTLSAGTSGVFGPRRRILLLAPLAFLLLAAVGWWVSSTVERSLKEQRHDELEALLRASVEGLTSFLADQEALAASVARKRQISTAVGALLKVGPGEDRAARLRVNPSQGVLRSELDLVLDGKQYEEFIVTDAHGLVIASDRGAELDADAKRALPYLAEHKVAKEARAWPPYLDSNGEVKMAVSAPIGGHTAAIHLVFDPAQEFYKLLRAARSGESGETYAFGDSGVMLSPSRFAERLRSAGLLPADATGTPLRFQIRDPGVDLTAGETRPNDFSTAPMTRAVATASKNKQGGYDVDGYRDYRGVKVIGAWAWLDKYNMGVVTEKDASEAFALRDQMRRAIAVLFVLLLVVMLGLLAVAHVASLLQRRTKKAEARMQRLGQYTLKEKLGEGGMGAVYTAHHMMLRRPTAIKLLKPEANNSDSAILRFEREVRMTSRLTHPNTIAIFDYGRTPDGTFYYAMELLDGVDLQVLVERTGPLSPARAIHVLLQACGSLHEAHEAHLIHRDIKPANMLLCTRGGIHDTIKVLDFGLVKETRTGSVKLTAVNAIMGTPAFMPPEIAADSEAATAASDIYSLGASAYLLLTGHLVFEKTEAYQMLIAHMNEAPKPLSAYVQGFPSDLEAVILRCLKKDPKARFASMEELADALRACADANGWTQKAARAWWQKHGARARGEASSRPPRPISGLTATIEVDLDRANAS